MDSGLLLSTYDTDTACIHETLSVTSIKVLGAYNHRLEKLMRLADILLGGGGWRKKSA